MLSPDFGVHSSQFSCFPFIRRSVSYGWCIMTLTVGTRGTRSSPSWGPQALSLVTKEVDMGTYQDTLLDVQDAVEVRRTWRVMQS